jgi:hypothetical protein
MSKKIFIIIGIVLVISLLGLVGYYLFLQKNSDGTVGNVSKIRDFFPFGGESTDISTTTSPNNNNQDNIVIPQQQNFALKLRKISPGPVAGAGLADFKAGTVVHHIEKATGHIFETELFSPIQNRISNTTIPTVYDATWGNNNNSLVARYLKEDNQTIDTYTLSLKTTSTTTENTISGIQFPINITDYSVFDGSIFYLEQKPDGAVGIVSNFDGSKKKQIWDSPIKELLSQYVNLGNVALTTKPYQNLPGFLYLVNTTNGQNKKILGGISGLSTLVSPDATKVLGISQTDIIRMFVYNMGDKSTQDITPATFPEKCVWSKKDKNLIYCAVSQEYLNGGSLTSWYMGLTTFSDDIWKYDIENNTASIVESFKTDTEESIDVIKPILSDNEQYLLFINKKDGSLWSLDLSK